MMTLKRENILILNGKIQLIIAIMDMVVHL